MPRQRDRFKRLEAELKLFDYNPPAGTRAFEYLNFKKGTNKIKVTNKPTSAERKRLGAAILPFNLPCPAAPVATDRYVASLTGLANTQRTNITGLSETELGYEALETGNKKPPNFYAAYLRIFAKNPTAVTTPTSQILKKEYRRYGGRSYSLPFGRSATLVTGFTIATVTEEDSKNALIEMIKDGLANAVISYLPELFTSPQADLPSYK